MSDLSYGDKERFLDLTCGDGKGSSFSRESDLSDHWNVTKMPSTTDTEVATAIEASNASSEGDGTDKNNKEDGIEDLSAMLKDIEEEELEIGDDGETLDRGDDGPYIMESDHDDSSLEQQQMNQRRRKRKAA